MRTFNQEIDDNKNWIFKNSLAITLFVLMIVIYVINFIKLPVYNSVVLEHTNKSSTYIAMVEKGQLDNYVAHQDIQVITEAHEILHFTIKSINRNTLYLIAKTHIANLNKSNRKGKIRVGNESLLNLILKSF